MTTWSRPLDANYMDDIVGRTRSTANLTHATVDMQLIDDYISPNWI